MSVLSLHRHHVLALAGAAGLSAIALTDAATHGLTGSWSLFSDDGDVPWVRSLGAVVHGLAYAGAVWVLHAERDRLRVNRAAAVFSRLALVAFLLLAAGFLLVAPLMPYGLAGPVEPALGPVIGVAFVVQIVAAAGVGLSLLRRPDAGPGTWVLASLPVVLVLTVLLGLVAADWAHPAYLETVTVVGVALLGARRRTDDGAPRAGAGVTSATAH